MKRSKSVDNRIWHPLVPNIPLLNHAAHRVLNGPKEEDPPKKKKAQTRQKWDLNGDGKLSLEEANQWYRTGNGQPITLDAQKVDLNGFIDDSYWKVGKKYYIQTLYSSNDGKVYGNIRVEYLGNHKVSILPDKYDFDMHRGSLIRNIATKIGSWVAGKGQAYEINFRGINKFRPRISPPAKMYP